MKTNGSQIASISCGSGVRAAIFSHRSTLFALLFPLSALLFPLSALLFLSGCATTQPRVVEVTATRRTKTVERVDKHLFTTDRASIIDFQPQPLPPSEQREEFFVRWTGAGVDTVKFEYRQANVPNTVMEQTYVPASGCHPELVEGSQSSGQGGEIPRQARNDISLTPSSPAHSPRRPWHVFEIRGDDFINGGPVTAWRVSLWNGAQPRSDQGQPRLEQGSPRSERGSPRSERGKLLAETKSALW